jgi:hypothetical protein
MHSLTFALDLGPFSVTSPGYFLNMRLVAPESFSPWFPSRQAPSLIIIWDWATLDPVRKHRFNKPMNLHKLEALQFIIATAECFLMLQVKNAAFTYGGGEECIKWAVVEGQQGVVHQIMVEWGIQLFILKNLPCYGLSVWGLEGHTPSTVSAFWLC